MNKLTDMSIEVRNLVYAYPDNPQKQVLNISEWTVDSGERLFVHGPSGTGKSTLLNVLGGILCGKQGEIRVLGERIDVMSGHRRDRFRASHIGYVFQQFNLIPYLNAVDNIQLAAHFNKSGTKKGLNKRIDEMLDSLLIPHEERTRPIAKLSVGQRQRIAIARAMINEPGLLIADEPTSSLDADSRGQFLSLLKAAVDEHNSTLLLVSHDMGLAEHFNRQLSLTSINHPQAF